MKYERAVIFSLENSTNEPNYEKLALLLVRSLQATNPEVDVYCGIFTDREPSTKVINELKANGVNVVKDIRFNVEADSVNYFLRNYCCYYFTHEKNLLQDYAQLIYLDIDVLVLRPLFNLRIPDNSILVEQVPDNILAFEKPYIGTIDHPLYYNWVAVLNESNKHVYNIDYANNTYLKQSDILVSQNINASGLQVIDQTVGAYYPKHKLSSTSILFHYDGFIDSGSFYKLEDYDVVTYKKYSAYASHVLNIKQENDKSFWNEF